MFADWDKNRIKFTASEPFSPLKIIDKDANVSEVFPYFAPVRGSFACGIRNPGLWNTEYSSRDPESTKDWNPESRLYGQIIRNQEPISRSEQLLY